IRPRGASGGADCTHTDPNDESGRSIRGGRRHTRDGRPEPNAPGSDAAGSRMAKEETTMKTWLRTMMAVGMVVTLFGAGVALAKKGDDHGKGKGKSHERGRGGDHGKKSG